VTTGVRIGVQAAKGRRFTAARAGRAAILFAAGGVMALGQAPWGLWFLTLGVLVALMWRGVRALRFWPAFRQGWLVGLGYFAVALLWIVEPFLVDVARHGWMAPFALVLMAGGLALFWGLAFGLARLIGQGGPARAALVLTLTGAEMTRSVVMTGFPWALIGHVWIDTNVAHLAAYVGAHGLTLLTLGIAASIAWLGHRQMPWLAVLPLVGLGSLWLPLSPGPASAPDPAAPIIRLVQPNVPQDQKWDPALMPVFTARLIDLSRGEAGAAPPALVVWPETAVPWLLEEAGALLEAATDAAGGATFAIGAMRREGERYYNALAVVDDGGQVSQIYDKAHLVPFGEYVPLGEIASRMGISGLAASEGGGFSAGAATGLPLELPGIGAALPLICYEGIFAPMVNRVAIRPRLMLLVTNDAWFGVLSGPYQHLAQGRLRAIEQGLPMVRVANTGVSAMIDGHGRITGRIDLGQTGAIDLPLPPALAPTIYAGLGDWPVRVLLVALAFALLLVRARRPLND
jgi:apolipoprotein N-acyltransferase